jgi:hypothetical protein
MFISDIPLCFRPSLIALRDVATKVNIQVRKLLAAVTLDTSSPKA